MKLPRFEMRFVVFLYRLLALHLRGDSESSASHWEFKIASASGSISSVHASYILPEGCSPSLASNFESFSASWEMGVTSTYLTPFRLTSPLIMALKSSISMAILARSRPSAKAVMLQSGIERTTTCDGRSPVKATALCNKAANSARNSSTARLRYWLFTPIMRVTRSYRPRGLATSIAKDNSFVVQPVRAMISGSSMRSPFWRSRWTSWTGHRSETATLCPIV